MAAMVCLSVMLIIGAILTILGGVMFPVFNLIIHNEIVQQTKLTNGTSGFNLWMNPPADIYMQFWIWDLVNPVEVLAGSKPALMERGPYTYRELLVKEQVVANLNDTLSYLNEKSYIFDREMSVGDPLVDNFTTINIPFMTVAAMVRSMGLPDFILKLLASQDPFPTHTVHEMIWGYADPLLAALKALDLSPYSEFGFFYERNNSNDGVYTVYSGTNEKETSLINVISRWEGEPSLGYWTTPQANMINGTDGSYNPPFAKKDETMYIFSSDICRSINAVYEKETSVRDIPTWRYVGPPEAFANASAYPPNIGFCTPDEASCLPSGLLNISLCQFGAPIVMSLPHFLYCDPVSVIDLVLGVYPDKEEHQTFFDVEPLTGGPLNVAKRLQINIYIQPYTEIPKIKDIRTLFLPTIWLNESALLSQDAAKDLKAQVVNPIKITNAVKYATLAIGGLIVIVVVTILTITWISRTTEQNHSHSHSHAHNGSDGDGPQTEPPLINHTDSAPLIA